jgi:hypothetical protein
LEIARSLLGEAKLLVYPTVKISGDEISQFEVVRWAGEDVNYVILGIVERASNRHHQFLVVARGVTDAKAKPHAIEGYEHANLKLGEKELAKMEELLAAWIREEEEKFAPKPKPVKLKAAPKVAVKPVAKPAPTPKRGGRRRKKAQKKEYIYDDVESSEDGDDTGEYSDGNAADDEDEQVVSEEEESELRKKRRTTCGHARNTKELKRRHESSRSFEIPNFAAPQQPPSSCPPLYPYAYPPYPYPMPFPYPIPPAPSHPGGNRFDDQFCTRCGHAEKMDALFCGKCGHKRE